MKDYMAKEIHHFMKLLLAAACGGLIARGLYAFALIIAIFLGVDLWYTNRG